MPYLWCTQDQIQAYLDVEGSIQIRTDDLSQADSVTHTFSHASAVIIENESVFEIATRVSLGFTSDTSNARPLGETVDTGVYGPTPLGFKLATDTDTPGTVCPSYLSILVAKLAASKIATVRLGASLSRLPNWVRVYKNEVNAQMQRWMLNAETAVLPGLTFREGIDMAELLIKIKTREMTAEDLEN